MDTKKAVETYGLKVAERIAKLTVEEADYLIDLLDGQEFKGVPAFRSMLRASLDKYRDACRSGDPIEIDYPYFLGMPLAVLSQWLIGTTGLRSMSTVGAMEGLAAACQDSAAVAAGLILHALYVQRELPKSQN